MAPCPLCNAADPVFFLKGTLKKEIAFSITDPSYGSQETLWRCRGCGGVFVHPLPDEKKLTDAYTGLEDPSYLEEEGRGKAAGEVLFLIERLLGRRGNLLDIGCFCGTLLSEAGRLGWEGEGIEPSRWARQKAREKFGLEIRYSSLREAAFREGSFDAVTAVDVLEHFLDPKEELAEIHRILKADGLLYLSTPDIGSLAARTLGSRWWGYRAEHLFYFSRRSLRLFLERLQFEPVWEGTYRRSFTMAQLVRRFQGVCPAAGRLFSRLEGVSFLQKRELMVNLFDRIALIVRKKHE